MARRKIFFKVIQTSYSGKYENYFLDIVHPTDGINNNIVNNIIWFDYKQKPQKIQIHKS